MAPARRWLSPRRWRFWTVLAVLVYTLGGFFAVPPAVEALATKALRDSLGRPARIERVRANPFVLSLEVKGFELTDLDGVRLAGFERLFVNFQLSSLFRWAWTFREITLDGPTVRLERFAPGDSRLGRLLADLEANAPPDPADSAGEAAWPRLLVQDLTLNRGAVAFRDAVPAEPVELSFGPASLSVQDLNTLPDRLGRQAVSVDLPDGARLSLEGSIDLAPLHAEGRLTLQDSSLHRVIAYLRAMLPLDAVQARLSLRTDYRIDEREDGSVDVKLDGIEADLTDLAVSGLEPATEFLTLSALTARGGALDLREQTFSLASVELTDPGVSVWFDENGELSLLGLAAAGPDGPESASAPVPDEPAAAPVDPLVAVPADAPVDELAAAPVDAPAAASVDAPTASPTDAPTDAATVAPATAPADAPGDAPADSAGDWQIRLDALRIAGGRIDFTDHQLEPPVELAVEGLALQAGPVSNEAGAEIPVDLSGALSAGGDLRFAGQVVALPGFSVSGTASVDGIPLTVAQPYVERVARIRLDDGAASVTAELALPQDGGFSAAGQLAVADLRVSNPANDEPLVGWKRLEIERFEADLAGGLLALSTVAFGQPYARIVVNQDRTTNLTGLIVPVDAESVPAEAESAPAEAEGPGLALTIGGIEFSDGALDFADLSLPLPFATEVRQLEGAVSVIDTASAEPSRLELEGQVGDYGLARIEGTMNPTDPLRHTDVSMKFSNLAMSDLSPYSAAFAGREIAAGKLDLDLLYRIDQGRLVGANDIVMRDLVLGDKVDSPGAASLPLGLAVALLKDANGVIDLELPVEGDVNDPKFRIGGVISKAFTSLIGKVVSAPFRLLGRLIGVESEDLGQFRFLAGRADLTPPEREKIVQLQEALQQRPELGVEVPGAYDPALDVPALQYQRLRVAVRERFGAEKAPREGALRMLSGEILGVLEDLYTERFPGQSLDDLKAVHRAPPADNPEAEPVLDQLAYGTDLRDRLLAAQEISRQDLEALAAERAESIRTAFLEGTELDAERVTLGAPAANQSEDGEWVVVELGIAAD